MRPKDRQLWRRSKAGQGVCERAVGPYLLVNLRDHCLTIRIWQLMLAHFSGPEDNSNWIVVVPLYAICCHADGVEQSRTVLHILWAASNQRKIHRTAGSAALHSLRCSVVDGTSHCLLA